MKTCTLGAALVAALLLNAGCGDDARLEAIESPIDDDFTTQLPVDPGTVHNEILAEMGAASIPAGTLTDKEYLERLVEAANRVFSHYGPSRALTIDDCKVILDIGRIISPLYDFRFEDPSRADPVTVIQYWHDHGLLKDQELVQLRQIFQETAVENGELAAAAIASEPVSDVVAACASVYQASLDYWSEESLPPASNGERPLRGDPDEIRKAWADALGGAIGHILGGFIGGMLGSAGTSTLFMIQEECWPAPCYGDGPPPDPCGGYRGIGPCP